MSNKVKEALNDVSNGNINAEVLTGEKAMNYAIPMLTKLYSELNPYITTVSTNNVLYFNSGEEFDDNAYPEKLLDYATNASAIHSNLIELKKNMLIGNGLEPVDKTSQETIAFLNTENKYGQTLQDIWSLLCYDYSIYEAYALETIYNGNGKIATVNHISPSLVRAVANADNPNLPFVNMWMISYNWAKITNKQYRRYTVANSGIPINNYNPKTWTTDSGRQLMYVKKYSGGNIPYAIPSYNSILPYVRLDNALSTYNLNSVTKGFTPQTIVSLPGNPSREERDQFVNKFKTRYSSENGERILFIWSTDSDAKPEILPFNEIDNTPMLELLDKLLTQKICSGHGANPELAGIQGSAGMSLQADANKIATSYNFFYATKIAPMQKEMITGINKIMRLNQLSDVTVVTPPLVFDTPVGKAAAVPQANNPNAIN